jgi:hypothetical protein
MKYRKYAKTGVTGAKKRVNNKGTKKQRVLTTLIFLAKLKMTTEEPRPEGGSKL